MNYVWESTFIRLIQSTAETVSTVPDNFKNRGGVYLITEIINQNETVRYVGKTDRNFDIRTDEHCDENMEENSQLLDLMQNRRNNVRIRYIIIDDKSDQSNIERTCYDHYRPSGDLFNDPNNRPDGTSLSGFDFPI